MLKAKVGKEIVVKVRNEIGVLSQIARIIADKGINILAVAGWAEGDAGVVHFVTEDNLRVVDALRQKNFNPCEVEVVITEVPHKPGMLRHVTETLAKDGINIDHLYASNSADANNSLIVFACANNDRAVVLLND